MTERKMMKKILKAAATVFLLLSLFTAMSCRGTDSGEEMTETEETGTVPPDVPVITICIPSFYEMSLSGRVEEEMNRISAARYGFVYDLDFVSATSYEQEMTMRLSDGAVDILFGSMQMRKHRGEILDLTEYWEKASSSFHEMWDEYADAVKIDGRIWGVPHLADYGHYLSLNIDEDIAADLGIEQDEEITLGRADEILAEIHERYPERTTIAGAGYTFLDFWTWDSLGGTGGTANAAGVISDRGQSDLTVHSIFEDEDYLMLCRTARSWYEKGWTRKDVLSVAEYPIASILKDEAAACIDMYGVNYIPGIVRTRFREVGNWTPSGNVSVSVYMIAAASEHPDLAFRALEALYTDPELDILLNNGIENVTYVKNGDGTISYPGGKTAAECGYAAASQFYNFPGGGHAFPLQENGADFFDRLWEHNRESLKTCCYGFSFDSEPVYEEYSACSEVLEKYYLPLLSGALPVDSTVIAAREEMQAAGEDIVIAEKQRQLDEFMRNTAKEQE